MERTPIQSPLLSKDVYSFNFFFKFLRKIVYPQNCVCPSYFTYFEARCCVCFFSVSKWMNDNPSLPYLLWFRPFFFFVFAQILSDCIKNIYGMKEIKVRSNQCRNTICRRRLGLATTTNSDNFNCSLELAYPPHTPLLSCSDSYLLCRVSINFSLNKHRS